MLFCLLVQQTFSVTLSCRDCMLPGADNIAHVSSAPCAAQFQVYSNCRDFFDDRWLDLKEHVFGSAPDLFPSDHFSYESFLWAVATLRAHVHPPLQGSQVALVPLADLVGCLPATQHLVDCILRVCSMPC